MVKLYEHGIYLLGGTQIAESEDEAEAVTGRRVSREEARKGTIAYSITEIGSVIYAVRPGGGSAREQAASCQRVLGGLANIAREYATKRCRSNVMNWGMIPFQMKEEPCFAIGDYIFVPGIRSALDDDMGSVKAYVVRNGRAEEISLYAADMTPEERQIVKAGCLINFMKK